MMVDALAAKDAAPRTTRPRLAAALTALAAAVLLCGYELIRSPSNTLYKAAYGAPALPYVMAAAPVAIIGVLYVYGRALTRLGPRRTLLATTLGSALLMAGALGGVVAGSRFATAILYVVREVYIVLLVEQYWSFLNSTLGTDRARRLNGPITGIGSLGAILGGRLVAGLAEPLGTETLVLAAALITLPTAVLMNLAYRQGGEPRAQGQPARVDVMGVRLLAHHRLLGVLLGVILLTQAVSTFLDLNFQAVLQDAIPDKDPQTAYSGAFFSHLNTAALVMSFVVTPALLLVVPLRLVHVAIPLVHVAACAYLLARPSLHSAGLAFLLFKALDYSLFRSAKEILYIPLSFDVRYRAKELIDVFGYRFGKGATSLGLSALRGVGMALGGAGLAAGALGTAAAWAVLAVPLGRSYALAGDRRQRTPRPPV